MDILLRTICFLIWKNFNRNTFYLTFFRVFRLWAYLMIVNLETRHAQTNLHFYYYLWNCVNTLVEFWGDKYGEVEFNIVFMVTGTASIPLLNFEVINMARSSSILFLWSTSTPYWPPQKLINVLLLCLQRKMTITFSRFICSNKKFKQHIEMFLLQPL